MMSPSAPVQSDRDEIGETGRWLDAQLAGRPVPPLLVVIGLGEGHLLDLLDKRAPETRVLALEPDPSKAAVFRARRDWSRWSNTRRLLYLVDPDYDGADEAWRMFPVDADAHKLVIHPAVAHAPGQGAVRAAQVAKRIVYGARANAEARKKFAPRYLANTIRNLPAIADGIDIRALTNFYRGIPAVVAAAGPSLDAVIGDLRATADRSVLIATGTALRPLLDAGLAPPLAVSLDPGLPNGRHFESLPPYGETWLVGESALDHAVTDRFEGRTFWFRAANHHPWPWINELGIDIGRLEVWGSVLTAAFQVAVLAGCDPIVLVGADLSYTDGRPHARGVTAEFTWARSVALGEALEHAWSRETMEFERLEVPDLRGRTTITSAPLQAFRDWMVTHAARSGRRVINATGAGTFFGDGIEQSSLLDALQNPCSIPSLRTISRFQATKVPRSDLAKALKNVTRSVGQKTPSTAPVAAWVEFTGAGYDPAAVAAALNGAAGALEAHKSEPTILTPTIPWMQLARSEATRGILFQLPEAIARLRAELNAIAPLPDLPGYAGDSIEGRTILLGHAVDLLARIRRALSSGGQEPSSAVDAGFLAGMPASAMYEWPESVEWTMFFFEALLGKALRSSRVVADCDYFSRPARAKALSHTRASAPSAARLVGNQHACALLAFEWLTCAIGHDQLKTPELGRLLALMRFLEAALRSHGQVNDIEAGVTMVLRADGDDWSSSVELPLPIADSEAKRLLTGLIQSPVSSPQSPVSRSQQAQESGRSEPAIDLARFSAPSISTSIAVRCATLARHPGACDSLGRLDGSFVTPRVLTEERITKTGSRLAPLVGRGGLATTFDASHALVTPANGTSSVLVNANGQVQQQPEWPRPIWGEVPWGSEGGSLAWHGPDRTILWRPQSGAPVQEMTAPFRPLRVATATSGAPIWCAFHGGLWEALPGTEPVHLVDTPVPIHLHLQADGVRIDPAVRREDGGPIRRRLTTGWFWRYGSSDLTSLELGDEGQCTSVAEAASWKATAHPYADGVRVTTPQNETVWLSCYYPLTVAWAGPSLVVGTGELDVLFFHNLQRTLAGGRS